MKRMILFSVFAIALNLFANGVGVVNAQNGVYLRLLESKVEVSVESQIATIKTTQVFINNLGGSKDVVFIFPLPESGSATNLRWKISNQWQTAVFSAVPQDTSLGGGGNVHANLKTYMGNTPLIFSIPDAIRNDSLLTVELTYVQLLKYSFGNVLFSYPNKYLLIQTGVLNRQEINFNLVSPRTIDSIFFLSHTPQTITNSGNIANIIYSATEQTADKDYEIKYSLNLNQLGLFSYSTVMPDSVLPDSIGKGFSVFVVEPNPNPAIAAIPKVFTLIIDRSGSMSWENKMEQAKNAAKFIVENFNEGDKFNIITFNDQVTSFKPSHVPFNFQNRDDALVYINALYGINGTNISGAFSMAIPQFTGSSDSTAKIIIFLTDGEATAGITSTPEILALINNLTQQTDTNITIFSFGVGSDVNVQLLTQISAQHHGLSEFLYNDELYARITDFYSKIRNPVLLNTKLSFVPNILTDVYPSPLPNLYKGQQLLIGARYQTPSNVDVMLSGNAFGQPVSYSYNVSLSDSNNQQYQFLMKLWAKLKIENLLVWYYSLSPGSATAMEIKQMIVNLSLSYGVLSPFTSFTGGSTSVEEKGETKDNPEILTDFELIGNYPNPFNPSTKISFKINNHTSDYVVVKIYNTVGELIRTFLIAVHSGGLFEVIWDGKNENGSSVPSGSYIYTITYGDNIQAGKMVMLK